MSHSFEKSSSSGKPHSSRFASSKLIDLSHPLLDGQPSFPSDPRLSIVSHATIATGKFNISRVTMGTHQGTHLDAMFHFLADGRTIDEMPLNWFYGPARLLRIPKEAGDEIDVPDFEKWERCLQPEAKIIFTTGWHKHFGTPQYFADIPSMTLEAGRYLVSRKIRLLGMDLPTPSKHWYEIHHIFLSKNTEIVLVEGLANLDSVPDQFIFAGFPLNFKGRDGSPIRAVAICPSDRDPMEKAPSFDVL